MPGDASDLKDTATALADANANSVRESRAPSTTGGLPTAVAPGTRYARVSNRLEWLRARQDGFVGAVLLSVDDRRDRVVLAWPSRPDSGFVTAALVAREVRSTGRRRHITLGLWPWRAGAIHAARSILVHPGDLGTIGSQSIARLRSHKQASRQHSKDAFAHESLSMVEMRLKDLDEPGARSASAVRNPTLLETTVYFPPVHSGPSTRYQANPDRFLKRVRDHTVMGSKGSAMPDRMAEIGNPLTAPFALFGLLPGSRASTCEALRFSRFEQHGLDAIVVDLMRTARSHLNADWERQFSELLQGRDASTRTGAPVVVLCDDSFTLRRASAILEKQNRRTGRDHLTQSGMVLLQEGVLCPIEGRPPERELTPLTFQADIKDAELAVVRTRFSMLMRTVRNAGHANEARKLGQGLGALRRFANLPVGIAEAKKCASILFPGDADEESEARSRFFVTSALKPMTDAAAALPEFANEIGSFVDEFNARFKAWEQQTPISIKLSKLLKDKRWNAREVLFAFPDATTADVFLGSDQGIACRSVVIDVSQLAGHLRASAWRRIVVFQADNRAVRVLLTTQCRPDVVLLLGDAASTPLLCSDLDPIISLPEFARFAERARALRSALARGGSDEFLTTREFEYHYHQTRRPESIDFTQANDGYRGDVIEVHLSSGAQVNYRPVSDVLLFSDEETRPFERREARRVRPGDSVLVLHEQLRNKLAAALSRSRTALSELRRYHERVATFRDSLPGQDMTAKARHVLAQMQALDASLGAHELRNIQRWLSVVPSEAPQPPRAARDRHRFTVFTDVIGISRGFAETFWTLAVLPSRAYSAQEGHLFNKRIVNFVLDPESVASAAGLREFSGIWQAIVDSVETVQQVVRRESSRG